MFSLKSSASKQAKSVALRAAQSNPAMSSKSKTVAKDFKGFEAVQGEGVVLVGKGTHIVGEITNCSVVEIQGVLEGTVAADVVIVRDGGGFKGDFKAEQAEIHGVVEGGVTVHGLLDIRATGKVTGDVTYEELAVAVGAHVSGQIASPATIEAAQPASIDSTAKPFEASSNTPSQPPHKQLNGGAALPTASNSAAAISSKN